jgi:hypothetical protein
MAETVPNVSGPPVENRAGWEETVTFEGSGRRTHEAIRRSELLVPE